MIPVSVFRDQTVAVYGLARSGLTAVEALVAGGAIVWAWDDRPEARAAAQGLGAVAVDLSAADWSGVAALVLSPGVPLYFPHPHQIVLAARAASVPIIGDVDVFMRSLPVENRPRVLGITGTNGKSTTTALLGHVLKSAGRDTQVGGNIGLGVLGLSPPRSGAHYVLELSSYQLDLMQMHRLDAAVLLNITPDHLDRHGDMAGYIAAKKRIFLNQTAEDTAVIGVDDDYGQHICTTLTATSPARVVPISAQRVLGRGVYALNGILYDATNGRAEAVADLRAAPSLIGRHNWQNAAAAYVAARGVGIRADTIAEALMSFSGLAHRMENLPPVQGVRFINDSKATNADAARQALSSFERVHWIAGGRAKDGGIAPLADLFPRVHKAYLIGEAAADFARALGLDTPHVITETLSAAVGAAFADARRDSLSNPIVLFSPACASFDQFSDFEARGDAFRASVAALVPASEVTS